MTDKEFWAAIKEYVLTLPRDPELSLDDTPKFIILEVNAQIEKG